MPWWAIAYLVFLVLILSISVIKDIIDQRGLYYIFSEFASGIVGISFIIACWHSGLASILSWFVIPMLIGSVSWDLYALRHMKKTNYKDLSEQENEDMHKFSKLFAVLFVSPCYIAGLYLSYQLIQNG